jgi:CBS domain-containing protein
MSREVIACTPDMDLARVGWLMWEGDCGSLPVVREGKIAGMITDRDLCMAAAMKPRPCTEIRVAEAMSAGDVAVVREDGSLEDALALMAERRVRRLPVLNADGDLVGIVSLNDAVRAAEKLGGEARVTCDQILAVLKAIAEPRMTATV